MYYYLNFEAPVSFFDIDFDGQNEILILVKHEGQRWSTQILVFELNGKKHSFIYDKLDSFGTSINITKKIISVYASGGYCLDHYDILKIVNNINELKSYAKNLLGKKLISQHTGAEGQAVQR